MEDDSTPAAVRKRALELGRPAFMAREDGAYHVLEMPKRLRCSYNTTGTPRRRQRRSHLLAGGDNVDSEEEIKKRAVDEPEFVVGEDGAYDITEMPKMFKCNYMADPDRSRVHPAVRADEVVEARSIARTMRIISKSKDYRGQLKAKQDAQLH